MAIDLVTTRHGEWMQTFRGEKFWPQDPRPEDIDIQDIAEALSKMCRYGGHCRYFYSVAEHCVLCARHVSQGNRLGALLHDASEAYLVDIPRQIKPALSNYYELENRLMTVIGKKYHFAWPLNHEIKDVDNRILRDEREQAMRPMDVPSEIWGDALPGLGVKLGFWSPTRAAFEFVCAFEEYSL